MPRVALPALAASLRRAGPDGVSALREAGRRVGVACVEELGGADELSESDPAEFWGRVRRWFEEGGYGDVEYEVLSGDVASVVLHQAPELSELPEEEAVPGCDFSAGLVGGLLSEIADRPLAVLEARCRARGDRACRFLVGEGDRLARIRERLVEGASLPEALGVS